MRQLLTPLWIVFAIVACDSSLQKSTPETVEIIEDTVVYEPTLYYGYPIDSFDIVEDKIKWNQTLSSILENYNISNEQIYEIANRSKTVYDVRKLKAGSDYKIIVERDSLHTARQFIFEPDQRSYVVYNFADSIYAEEVKHEVKLIERSIAGEINSSVYETVMDLEAPAALVNKLVDVLAWQVDFFRINKGDKFKVIYEEERVGEEIVGIGKIKGVYFKHYDKEYYGVYFDQGTQADYFDEHGNSLRKTFLRTPLNFTRISSRFSPRRYHPVLKRYKAHLGTDYAAPVGTPIRTVGDGIVIEAKYSKYNGNYVKIKHNANYTTQYLHMNKIRSGIRPGTRVKQGQTIGYVGQTGLANGPHLCFRFWKNGRQVDALKVDLPPSEPVKASELSSFIHQKNVVLHQLKNIQFPDSKMLLARVGSQQ